MALPTVPQILVVDDDPEIRRLLAKFIETQGLRVLVAANRRELEERLATQHIDLVVLDVLLPDGSGLDICRDLRARRSRVPIILLTALKEDVDRIIGLELGADDYLGKPFNPRELVARIRAVLRRRTGEPSAPAARTYRFEGWTLEPDRRRLADASGLEADLTAGEFDLLLAFLERPGRVLSRDQLLDLTRGRDGEATDRSIDVLVSRLRRKLQEAGPKSFFKTVRNGGYQFTARVETLEGPA